MADPDSAVRAQKDALRAEIVATRGRRTDAERSLAGRGLAALAAERLVGVGTVAAYLSFGSEPPTGDLIAALLTAKHRVVVPVVDGEALDWVEYDGGVAPTSGALGIPSPAGPRLGLDTLASVGAILVPALAADRDGNRLGRGRGYYDRALTAVTAPVIAVVYDDELLDVVPVEAHDRRVDAVLTPSVWVDLAGR